MNRSYIVSQDIQLLLKQWAGQRNFILPSADFFAASRLRMTEKLEQIFKHVKMLEEEDLQKGAASLIQHSIFPVVSLDRIYVEAEHYLDLTRLSIIADSVFNEIGLQSRHGAPSIDDQVNLLMLDLSEQKLPWTIALFDDVIYSGNGILKVIDLLKKVGVTVAEVYVAVGVTKGVDKIRARDIPVKCVYEFDEVIDEICERDFFPGVPLSGKLIDGVRHTYLSLENIGDCASIPEEHQRDFSLFCWQQTAELFAAIEECSGKPVLCRDLGVLIHGIPTNGTRYVEAIETVLLSLN